MEYPADASQCAFLTPHTDRQLLDFYHVTEYLAKASEAVFPQKTGKAARKQWLSTRCSQLKHPPHAAQRILEELQSLPTAALSESVRAGLEAGRLAILKTTSLSSGLRLSSRTSSADRFRRHRGRLQNLG